MVYGKSTILYWENNFAVSRSLKISNVFKIYYNIILNIFKCHCIKWKFKEYWNNSNFSDY